MADYSGVLLEILSKRDSIDSLNLSEELSVDHQRIVGAIKSLQCFENIIDCEQTSCTRWQLTGEGEEIAKHGSHEVVVFNAVPPEGIKQEELLAKCGAANAQIGFSKAMSLKWITIDKKVEGGPRVFRKVDSVEDSVQKMCQLIGGGRSDDLTDKQKSECKKRKLFEESKVATFIVRKGEQFTTNPEKEEVALTAELLASGLWKTKKLKPFNFNAKGIRPQSGHWNPLLKVRSQFRQIFLEMGFSEMPTNNFVESSFWNFDALFQPQHHPARDSHDTFFLSDPATTKSLPMDYVERVKTVHSKGGYGSQGYNYDWKFSEASKNVMRTHTTAVSARMLYKLATQPTFVPSKLFSIDRVFRNETLDATHLAEFHQVEGLVADYRLSLGDLMGYIQMFFNKYGMTDLKFKPAYNPYTEPSMEIFSYHDGLKKWVEIGNSGMFRSEMLLPMGLPADVKVIAWGLSLERPTMIKYGIKNIRELFGHKVDLQKIYDDPICRLGDHSGSLKLNTKHREAPCASKTSDDVLLLQKRHDRTISRLTELKSKMDGLLASEQTLRVSKSVRASIRSEVGRPDGPAVRPLPPRPRPSGADDPNVAIYSDPSTPPLCLFVLLNALQSFESTAIASFVHSSVDVRSEKMRKLKEIFVSDKNLGNKCEIRVAFVWKDLTGATDSAMTVGFDTEVRGERNVARYLASLVDKLSASNDFKSSLGRLTNRLDNITMTTVADDLVEFCTKACDREVLAGRLGAILKNNAGPFLFGASPSLADIIVWSSLVHSEGCLSLNHVAKKWKDHCSQMPEFSSALQMFANCS